MHIRQHPTCLGELVLFLANFHFRCQLSGFGSEDCTLLGCTRGNIKLQLLLGEGLIFPARESTICQRYYLETVAQV